MTRRRHARRNRVFAQVRVGSPRFDNVMDGGLGDEEEEELESFDWIDAPDELSAEALQMALWKLTQLRFDEAQEAYLDHKKARVSEYLRDEVDSFSKQRCVQHREAVDPRSLEPGPWTEVLRRLSRRFLEHPKVYDPSINLRVERTVRVLCNTDAARVITEDVYVEANVTAWVLSPDGVYVESDRSLYRRRVEDVPTEEELTEALESVLAELAELEHAVSPGSYLGPALLYGQPVACLFHEALGHRLEGERLVARGETRTFADRVGDLILPRGLDVADDPTLRCPETSAPYFGSFAVDDEGVRAERVDLVRDGVLQSFLQSRAPIPSSAKSNGHARHDGVRFPMARMGNLVITASQEAAMSSEAELRERLFDLARASGRREVMVVERVRQGETQTSSYDFQAFKSEPSAVYLVDVETQRTRRVRDVELIGTPLAALQRIVAFGGATGRDDGWCWAESGSVPVSGFAPMMVFSEIELQQRSTTGFHEPLLPAPVFEDGSHGRTSGLRGRGRRNQRS
jgi:predicted Zn-dependent protease